MKFSTVLLLLVALSGTNSIRVTNFAEPVDHSKEFFTAGDSGMAGEKPYERKLPN